MNTPDPMSVNDALKKLGIEDYGYRIFNSNSHGELFHLLDYIQLASTDEDMSWFRPMFLICVRHAEQNWERPESCFQHMPRLLAELAAACKDE